MKARGFAKCGAAVLLIVFVFAARFQGNAYAWDDPKATVIVGASTNTNIFNKPEEINDKINDLSLNISMPHELKKKTDKLNLSINYKQDWKAEQEKLNSRSSTVKLELNHTFSKKTSGKLGYSYQDFDTFLGATVNASLSTKITKNNSLKIDYSYATKRFPNKKSDATTQTLKMDYKITLTKKTSLTPFFAYESNGVPGSLASEYKGTTAGLRYEWKMSKKTTLTTSYDLRSRDYDNATKASLSGITAAGRTELVALGWSCTKITAKKPTSSCTYKNVTRVEKRGQFSLGLKYMLQKNADLNFKYTYYKNNADSSDPGSKFGATKDYSTHIFAVNVTLRSVKAKKAKKSEEAGKDSSGKGEE